MELLEQSETEVKVRLANNEEGYLPVSCLKLPPPASHKQDHDQGRKTTRQVSEFMFLVVLFSQHLNLRKVCRATLLLCPVQPVGPTLQERVRDDCYSRLPHSVKLIVAQ